MRVVSCWCGDNKSVVEGGQPVASKATSARGLDRAALEKLSLTELKTVALQLGVQNPTGHKGRKATYVDSILGKQGVSSSSSSSSSSPPAKAQQAGSSSSAAAATTKKANGQSGKETGLALLIGASQEGQNVEGGLARGGAAEFRSDPRVYVPRDIAKRGSALPDVHQDVKTVRDYIEKSLLKVTVHKESFVGGEGKKPLTRKVFRNKVKSVLDKRGHKLYLLYYAGHGVEETGAFCLEDGVFTFDDLLYLWEHRKGVALRHSLVEHFLIIADSCYSGALVHALRERSKQKNDLNVAVQAACRENEFSCGGIFTETFTQKQCSPDHKFQWENLYKKALAGVECTTCRKFHNDDCRGCCALNRDHGYPRNKEDIQHPIYFAISRGETRRQVEVGDNAIRLFKRYRPEERRCDEARVTSQNEDQYREERNTPKQRPRVSF